MKKTWNYFRIKWTAFSITIAILGIGLAITLLTNRFPEEKIEDGSNPPPVSARDDHYTNEEFTQLLEERLQDFDIIQNLSFFGTEEGCFTIRGNLINTDRLLALCPELTPYKTIVSNLEGQTISLQGHLGEDEKGSARLIADTIEFSDQKIPIGEATFYIEQYTNINQLFSAPFDQITLNQEGITYESTE